MKVVSKGPHVTLHHLFIVELSLSLKALDDVIGDVVGILLGGGASGQGKQGNEQNEEEKESEERFHSTNLERLG